MFITKIQNVYYLLKPPIKEWKTVVSLTIRSKFINKDCLKFTGCYNTIRRYKPTEVTDTDIINMKTGLYNGITTSSTTDESQKLFKFFGAWEIMRDHPKFQGGLQTSPTSTSGPKSITELGVVVLNEHKHDGAEKKTIRRSAERPQ